MMQKVVVKRPPEQEHGEEMEELAATDAEAQEHAHDLLDETDELLKEIEETLGENLNFAQEFVAEYIQKGGQ
jgi:ubiquitin-like protein Pup